MRDTFYSYLDGFNKITIIFPKSKLIDSEKKFYLLAKMEPIELSISEVIDLGGEMKYICNLSESINLSIEYYVIDEASNKSVLRTGAIVRSDLFEMLFYYDKKDLGATYTKEKTIFKLWSPVAKEVEIELIDLDGKKSYYDLVSMPRGIWCITIDGNLECYKYLYHVRTANQFHKTLDPYAISSTANNEYNYVIDKSKLYEFRYPKPEFSGRPVDAVIYEMHIRDFTIDPVIKNSKKGTYLGLLENNLTPAGHPTGLEYIKNLGFTHIQLQPIYAFGGVDEVNKDLEYNWGYNPVQYNVPSGWFSENPDDPYSRINELRMLIDEIHHHGMRVIMDVVYNHVYNEFPFPFDTLVPGYFFRYDERGMKTNISGCGNDVASDRRMCRKFILDSLDYWMTDFNLSGFRFDLMGLLDIETMNQAQMQVKTADPNGIIYGEGWNMPINLPDFMRANMSNYRSMPQIGFFNDRFRDTIKGSQWTNRKGYILGGKVEFTDILYLLTGSSIDNFLLGSPSQSINYVECHDNYTLYDFSNVVAPELTEAERKDAMALAISMVILSQGVPFIHAGQEFFRTKYGEENSYKSSDDINMIDWTRCDENWDNVMMVKDLIAIRKKYSAFRYDRKSVIKERYKLFNSDINFESVRCSIKSESETIYLIVKNNYKYEYIDFEDTVTMIFDGRRGVSKVKASCELEKPGVYVFMKGRE